MKTVRPLLNASRLVLRERGPLLLRGFAPAMREDTARLSVPTCSYRPFSSASTPPTTDVPEVSNSPTKETLLRVDWMMEHFLPGLMKARLKPFFDIVVDNAQFEDKLYNYKLSSRAALYNHIAKMRIYFRYKSPYNKVEYVGSCVYEGEDVVVLLWRLSYLESNFWSYLPSFLTKKEPKINVIEGALDLHVTKEGMIYKIVNRKVTASDLEGAKALGALKKEQGDKIYAEEEREWRKKLREEFEAERISRV